MFKRKAKHPSSLPVDTLVGVGANIRGDVEFKGGLHVDGVIHGNVIALPDTDSWVSVSDSGVIEGEVRVPNVLLNGRVQGDLHATQRVELGGTAQVHGNVHYNLIEMALGAQINGKLVHIQQDAPEPLPTIAIPPKLPEAEKSDAVKSKSADASLPLAKGNAA